MSSAEVALITALLRARGGISRQETVRGRRMGSSPRTRRYFRLHGGRDAAPNLFSAHAEVFPCINHSTNQVMALLRARGGISCIFYGAVVSVDSSPRTRRYFLLSRVPKQCR